LHYALSNKSKILPKNSEDETKMKVVTEKAADIFRTIYAIQLMKV
jgi:hypothetical protein